MKDIAIPPSFTIICCLRESCCRKLSVNASSGSFVPVDQKGCFLIILNKPSNNVQYKKNIRGVEDSLKRITQGASPISRKRLPLV